ncbi:hypothetical protein Tco_0829573 [Tanacetum coccineum]
MDYTIPVDMFYDSSATIQIDANPGFHKRKKHFKIDLYFLREKIVDGVFKTSKIQSKNNTANVLTKGPRFEKKESYNLEEAITRRTNTLCLVRHILRSGGRIDIVDSLIKMTIEDVLVQQGIDEALEEKQPAEMKDDVWKTMQKKASSTIRLTLAPEIKYSVLKEKTPKDI